MVLILGCQQSHLQQSTFTDLLYCTLHCTSAHVQCKQSPFYRAEIFEQYMGGRNRVGIGFSSRPAGLHRLAEFIPWNRFLGSINVQKFGLCLYGNSFTFRAIHSLSGQSIHFQGNPFTFRAIHSLSEESIHVQGNQFTFRTIHSLSDLLHYVG